MDMEIEEFASHDSDGSVAKKLKHNEDSVDKDIEKSTIVGGSTSASPNSDNLNGSNSDLSYHNDNDAYEAAVEVDDVAVDEVDYVSDYDDNDEYMYADDDDDVYLSMQAQFDNVDLPPGVEASVSWLQDPAPSANAAASTSPSPPSDAVGQHAGSGTSSLKIYDPTNKKTESATTSSLAVLAESSSAGEAKEETVDDVLKKYEAFKRFDTVDDFSDHHYINAGLSGQQPSRTWSKKIQEEWKILEKDLPDTIYVRVYETRMDLLRAIIVGPAGTPYHDGLFVFDVVFPPNYPDVPPMVYYYSGGLRLNPNLYNCGKVCLSLLNTWSGQTTEMWMPKQSTMLQVLVSIQALILNAKPYFNEPGYANMSGRPEGESASKQYNEDAFLLSLKTMMYTLRRPPMHFEDLVASHFRLRAHDILSACKAYMEGAEVGSAVNETVQHTRKAGTNHAAAFKAGVAKMMNGLVSNFIRHGCENCEQFRLPG